MITFLVDTRRPQWHLVSINNDRFGGMGDRQMGAAVRHTVCPAVVGTVTSYIMWADAEHAAAIGAAPVSPYKQKSPTDREWTRRYNQARQCIRNSGYTQSGLRVTA